MCFSTHANRLWAKTQSVSGYIKVYYYTGNMIIAHTLFRCYIIIVRLCYMIIPYHSVDNDHVAKAPYHSVDSNHVPQVPYHSVDNDHVAWVNGCLIIV